MNEKPRNDGAIIGSALLVSGACLLGYLTIPSLFIAYTALIVGMGTGLFAFCGTVAMMPEPGPARPRPHERPGTPGYCAPARNNPVTGRYSDAEEQAADAYHAAQLWQEAVTAVHPQAQPEPQPAYANVTCSAEEGQAIIEAMQRLNRPAPKRKPNRKPNRYNERAGFVPKESPGIAIDGWPTSASQIRVQAPKERGVP